MPHQAHLWDVALELDDDGRFVYDTVDLTIMRRQGKTSSQFAKTTWRMTVAPKLRRPDGKLWGRQRALYTSQRGKDARKTIEQVFAQELRDNPGSFREITNVKGRPSRPYEWKLSMNNGAEHILFGRGNYFAIDAPVAEAGHSDSLDDANLDEIWALENGEIEQGIGPTMATRWNPQTWRFSTAGNEKSFYLYPIVLAGRGYSCTCGARYMDDCVCGFADRPHSRTCYFEWSIPEDANIDDEDVWWEFMPALGRTVTPEFVRGKLDSARRDPHEGEEGWRRAYGNQWVKIPLIGGAMRIPKLPVEQWGAAAIDVNAAPDRRRGEVAFGFAVSRGGTMSTITASSGSPSYPFVEITGEQDRPDHREGTGWLVDRLVELVLEWQPLGVAFRRSGPAGALEDVIREAFRKAGIDDDSMLKPLSMVAYKAACGALFLAVKEDRLLRADQAPLAAAGADAPEKRSGDAFVWDDTGDVPITPLEAGTCALSLLLLDEEESNLW